MSLHSPGMQSQSVIEQDMGGVNEVNGSVGRGQWMIGRERTIMVEGERTALWPIIRAGVSEVLLMV